MKTNLWVLSCLVVLFTITSAGCGGADSRLKHGPEIKARSFGSFGNFCRYSFSGFIHSPSTALAFIRMDGKFREMIMLTETITNNSAA